MHARRLSAASRTMIPTGLRKVNALDDCKLFGYFKAPWKGEVNHKIWSACSLLPPSSSPVLSPVTSLTLISSLCGCWVFFFSRFFSIFFPHPNRWRSLNSSLSPSELTGESVCRPGGPQIVLHLLHPIKGQPEFFYLLHLTLDFCSFHQR